MKNLYAAFLLLIPLSWSAQVGLVSNGDFENWTTTVVDVELDEFETSNMEFPGLVTISRSTDAAHLSYSVLMETKNYFSDTAFAYIINGDIDGASFSNGVPHATNVDSVKVRLKYDVMPGDSATIAFLQYGGAFPWLDTWKLTGTQNSWTTMSFPVFSIPHDSIIFAASSSNAFGDLAIPGSWLQIDHVEFVNNGGANEDMPNNSFESWTDLDYEDPDSWTSYNNWGAYVGGVSTFKSTNSYSGTYAADLQVVEVTTGIVPDTANPLLTNGDIDTVLGPVGGVPYTSMPTNFEGAYDWSPASATDSAWISIGFKDNTGSFIGGNVVALGNADATTGYQTFNISTNLFTAPDSMIIAVYVFGDPGASLLVDALQLTGNGVGLFELPVNAYQVYPNPASQLLNVKGANNGTLLNLYSLDGKLINSVRGNSMDTENIAKGTYVISIDGNITRKVVINR